MPMMPSRITTGNAPVQMGAARPMAPVAPRITTGKGPNPVMAKSMGPKYYAKGGTASARADGCAERGKTRCKFL
jgi:hypothetical protein